MTDDLAGDYPQPAYETVQKGIDHTAKRIMGDDKPDLNALADKFTVGDGCWEWTAYKTPLGYGQVRRGVNMTTAQRAVYEALVGPVPDGLELDHLCRNPSCVRPDHLEPVTHQENMRRGDAGLLNASKTHCVRGHLLDAENLRVRPDGRRQCRECQRVLDRDWHKEKRRGSCAARPRRHREMAD